MSKDQMSMVDVFRESMAAPPDLLETMANRFEYTSLEKGENWLRPGQYCRHIGFLKSGLLRAAVETDDGLHTRWAFLPGQFFTSLQSFSQQTASAEHIIAVEDCEIYLLGRTSWLELYERHDRLRRFWTQMLETQVACFEDRVHALLMKDAKSRYQHLREHYPDFVLYVPQKYVAEMLGIAPRHLSRIRRELSEAN